MTDAPSKQFVSNLNEPYNSKVITLKDMKLLSKLIDKYAAGLGKEMGDESLGHIVREHFQAALSGSTIQEQLFSTSRAGLGSFHIREANTPDTAGQLHVCLHKAEEAIAATALNELDAGAQAKIKASINFITSSAINVALHGKELPFSETVYFPRGIMPEELTWASRVGSTDTETTRQIGKN